MDKYIAIPVCFAERHYIGANACCQARGYNDYRFWERRQVLGGSMDERAIIRWPIAVHGEYRDERHHLEDDHAPDELQAP